MIIPFMFGVENKRFHYSWIFYKFAEFAKKNNYPIIAQEEYFRKPSLYKKEKYWLFDTFKNGYNAEFKIQEPTDKFIDSLEKFIITLDDEEKIFSEYSSREEGLVKIQKKRNLNFEKVVEEYLNKISEKGSIDAIMTWVWFPSLEYCAKKYKAKVILLEQSTFRKPNYNFVLGYCQTYNKYSYKEIKKKWSKFNKHNKCFTRKELQLLLMDKSNFKYLKIQPEYEVGLDLGVDDDNYFKAYSSINYDKILKELQKKYLAGEVLVRTHPMREKDMSKEFFTVDNSANSIEWIMKCKQIISIISNVGFETMLYGKTHIALERRFPYYYKSKHTISNKSEKIVDEKYINYLIFAYYVPFDLMFDNDYLKWRLKENDINKIYDYNLNYLIKEKEIDEEFFTWSQDKKEEYLLEKA